MSTRYRYVESDGDISAPASALEVAIDQFAIQFLSSSEAENVVNALWRGQLVAEYGDNDNIEYVPFDKDGSASFWDHLNVHRLQVPRYQNVSIPSFRPLYLRLYAYLHLRYYLTFLCLQDVLHRDLAFLPLHLLSGRPNSSRQPGRETLVRMGMDLVHLDRLVLPRW